MPSNTFRIDVPGNPDDLIKLAKKIRDKHVALGDDSPIKGLKNMDQFAGKLTTADTKNEASKQLYKDAEQATQDRDLTLGQTGQLREQTVRYWVTSARDVLQGLNKGNEQALGGWGFSVDTSSRVKKAAPPAKA